MSRVGSTGWWRISGGADGRTLLFSHGHLLRVLAARWLGHEVTLGAQLLLDPAAISALGFERGTAALRLWNET